MNFTWNEELFINLLQSSIWRQLLYYLLATIRTRSGKYLILWPWLSSQYDGHHQGYFNTFVRNLRTTEVLTSTKTVIEWIEKVQAKLLPKRPSAWGRLKTHIEKVLKIGRSAACRDTELSFKGKKRPGPGIRKNLRLPDLKLMSNTL